MTVHAAAAAGAAAPAGGVAALVAMAAVILAMMFCLLAMVGVKNEQQKKAGGAGACLGIGCGGADVARRAAQGREHPSRPAPHPLLAMSTQAARAGAPRMAPTAALPMALTPTGSPPRCWPPRWVLAGCWTRVQHGSPPANRCACAHPRCCAFRLPAGGREHGGLQRLSTHQRLCR